MKLSYDELRKLPSTTLSATIECAGNGRAFLVPKAKGVLWETGGIGNAEWTGVPLSTVLDRAGVQPEAVEVVLAGADKGEVNDEPKSPGPIHFERSLPLQKARRSEVILAYQMNGQDLTAEHGFPVRAVVPGWFGMSSVKWLVDITVAVTPFNGYWQSLEYSYFQRQSDRPSLMPVTNMLIKASISRPAQHEAIPAGSKYRVFGAAWAGESEVASVELSVNGGKDWQVARLLGRSKPFSWRLWEYDWDVPTSKGHFQLMTRATDDKGVVQPDARDKDRRGYMINHVVPVQIELM